MILKQEPKTCQRIQVVKNAKCNIIHSFFFYFFIFIYHECNRPFFKSYHGIFEFQLDDKEQKWQC